MPFRSDLSALILATLQAAPLHGYEIVRRIRDAGVAQKLTEGQIYPYLHRLEEDRLVSAEWQTDTGAAPRRVYRLTEAGTKELIRQRGEWKNFADGVSMLMSTKEANGA